MVLFERHNFQNNIADILISEWSHRWFTRGTWHHSPTHHIIRWWCRFVDLYLFPFVKVHRLVLIHARWARKVAYSQKPTCFKMRPPIQFTVSLYYFTRCIHLSRAKILSKHLFTQKITEYAPIVGVMVWPTQTGADQSQKVWNSQSVLTTWKAPLWLRITYQSCRRSCELCKC